MHNFEQRIAKANEFIGDYESYRKELIAYHHRPEAVIIANAIDLLRLVIADAEAYGENFEAAFQEVHAMIKHQLDQMKFAREAIKPDIFAFINNLRLSNSHRLDLEEAINVYLLKQMVFIQNTGNFNQDYAQDFNKHCLALLDPFESALEGLMDGIEGYSDLTGPLLVNATSLKELYERNCASQDALAVAKYLHVEQQQALLQLEDQIASLRVAVEAIAHKSNALGLDGYAKKAHELRLVEEAINTKIDDYERDQKQAIGTIGRMSQLKAAAFKADCHRVIADNKAKFTRHADVLPVLANFLLTVASAVCAFIPLLINKAQTGSCFSFFNTATTNTLIRAEKAIESAIKAPGR
ncbi:MAG: hypothetical protein K0R66_366 [Gammaproteobacteria bacterium]|nr:hypothetical protein [Gammaproteobacteria bacterium]